MKIKILILTIFFILCIMILFFLLNKNKTLRDNEKNNFNKELFVDRDVNDFDNPFGVFLPYNLNSKDKLDSAKELGINKTRIIITWEEIEPEKNQFDFSFFDLQIDELCEANVTPVVTIKSKSSWATKISEKETYDNISTSAVPRNWDDYENFIEVLINRYKDRVKYWQIENEIYEDSQYWAGSNEEYLEMLKHAYKTIKSIDLESKVVLQGFANQMFIWIDEGNEDAIDFFNYLMSNGEYFDVVDFHQYFEPDGVYDIIKILKKTMDTYGYNKPIICTEAGAFDLRLISQEIRHVKNPSVPGNVTAEKLLSIPAVFSQLKKNLKGGLLKQEWIDFGIFLKTNKKSRPILEKYQAEDLVKRVSSTLGQGVDFIEWVPMVDFKKPTLWYFSHMGLIDANGRKKPHFYTYKILIDKLTGFTDVEEISSEPRIIKFDFTSKEPVYVVWGKEAETINMEKYFSKKEFLLTNIVTELDKNNNPIYLPSEKVQSNSVKIKRTPVFFE